ncbi:YidH family protein [Pseudonocardia bannensis]|uniref:DUF202 domain-containing protein n=1 Tax=Pseudonocardia bannensis TaxID=630973 RepID=A0A848DRH7_9PSEU|nr:DUF202 domain-containing protein [Pseudonocardia bannensis]NMH95113.1 DUF202 domain-containing protein [Pseudonocardia bannensis]
MRDDRPRTNDAGNGREPDYRFTLANERTFLAWLRTALALDAAGLAVAHLLPELVVPGAREAVALALVLLGAVVAVSGYRRWRAYQRAMRRDEPLPPTRLPGILMAALTGLAVLTLALLLAGPGLRP